MNLFLAILFMISPTPDFEPGINETTSDSVESNFIVRSEDLFWEIGNDHISLDRLSISLNDRYTGYFGRQPRFVVDGIPIDVDYFGTIHPQYLPIALGRISDLYYDKRLSEISLNSHELEEGLSFYGSTYISNEAGEPGPWVYDPDRVTPNIERFGPGVDLQSSYRSGEWYAKGLFRFHRHLNSNLSVQNRMKNMVAFPETAEYLDVESTTRSGTMEVGFYGENGTLKARSVHGRSHEFLFFRPLGREVPTDISLDQYSLYGDYRLNSSWTMASYVQHQIKRLDERRNTFGHNFDWGETRQNLRLSAERTSGRSAFELGTEIYSVEHEGDGLNEFKKWYADLDLSYQFSLNDNTKLKASPSVTLHNETSAPSVLLEGVQYAGDKWSGRLAFFYGEELAEFAYTSDYLARNGFELYNQLNIPFSLPSMLDNIRYGSIKLGQNFQVSEVLSVELNFENIHHIQFHIPAQPVEYDLDYHTFPGDYTFDRNVPGSRLIGELAIDYRRSSTLAHTVTGSWSRTVSSNAPYRRYWEIVPERIAAYRVQWSPFPDLEIDGRLRYRSSSRWRDFENLDGEQFQSFNTQVPLAFGEFKSELPSHLNIDLNVAKWFWDQQFRGVVMMKNILNREYYSHPLAARESFTFALKAELRF